MAIKKCLIGIKSHSKYDNYGVDYLPDYENRGNMVTVWEGTLGGAGRSGATLSPQDLLKRFGEGKAFRRYFEITDCEWFIPYLMRMANGEDVSIEEIEKVYQNNNNGEERTIITS